MRFFLLLVAFTVTANAQTLRYSIRLPSLLALCPETGNEMIYNGKGGWAFVAGYYDDIFRSQLKSDTLFWINAKNRKTTDGERTIATIGGFEGKRLTYRDSSSVGGL